MSGDEIKMGNILNRSYVILGVKVLLALITYHLSLITSLAQDAPEYRMEVGGGIGTMAYQGDLNGSLTKNMQFTGGLVAKHKLNPRMAWAFGLNYGQLKGSSKSVKTWYPDEASEQMNAQPGELLSFSTRVIDLDARYEYNFWPFGTGREYLGAKPLTPFFALGAGLTFAKPKDGDTAVGFQFPIGVGVKYKLADRLNLAAEWMMHFTGTDGLDGLKDPYGIESNGLFKNTDSYSVLRLTLTYDIWEKCKTCMNDRD